jgi:hypothetical protein
MLSRWNEMKKLNRSLLLLAIAAMANAQYPLEFNYSTYGNPYLYASQPYQTVFPVDLSPGGRAFESVTARNPVTGEISGGFVAVGSDVDPPIVAWGGGPITGFRPADLVNDVSFPQTIFGPNDYRMIGTLPTSTGTKIAYYRGGFGIALDQDYIYTGDGWSNDFPLKLGEYPYGDYAAVSLRQGGTSELAVLLDTEGTSAPNPELEFTAPEISPIRAYFRGATFLVEGLDNDPDTTSGGYRVAAYKINPNGSLSRDFSLRFENGRYGDWTINHTLCLGPYSDDFVVVADNERVDNGAGDTRFIYTIFAYDASGKMLWHSNPRVGVVTAVSVGTASNIYVTASDVPGEYLYQYNSTAGSGNPQWSVKCNPSKISSAADLGVVYAVETPDAKGHLHITIFTLDANGNQLQTLTYASQPTNNDLISDLLWTTDGKYYYVYLVGLYVQPNGQDGIFGSQWDTWGAYYP